MNNLIDFDVIFISFDEENAEKNWLDLQNKAPWAKRVHGVSGFDNAHKAAAELANTDHFITIDGDNIVDDSFLFTKINIDDYPSNSIFSYSSRNIINGLVYGNGSVKLWPKKYVLTMKTHENADDSSVEFCWNDNYYQSNVIMSETIPNTTPYQAFRAGFREGVKMCLDQGNRLTPDKFDEIYKFNKDRLMIWSTIGNDVENGDWAIYGTRLGWWKTLFEPEWNYSMIRDYTAMVGFWDTQVDKNIQTASEELKTRLNDILNVNISSYDQNQSKFFKSVYNNPPRTYAKDFGR